MKLPGINFWCKIKTLEKLWNIGRTVPQIMNPPTWQVHVIAAALHLAVNYTHGFIAASITWPRRLGYFV